MPVTRRRRATSPEQPENTNTAAQSPEQAAGSPTEASTAAISSTEQEHSEKSSVGNAATEPTSTEVPATPLVEEESSSVAAQETSYPSADTPAQLSSDREPISHAENDVHDAEEESVPSLERSEHAPTPHLRRAAAARAAAENLPYQPLLPSGPTNGERQEYVPNIEGGRRTARGELFRRPPQVPTPQYTPPVTQPAQLQAPTHEISLPLGNLLHLAYNPGYTGSEEARNSLLHELQEESKSGGRARCWSCGSLAIVYDRWNTRSKTFGEIGIAYCEICGVWSVM